MNPAEITNNPAGITNRVKVTIKKRKTSFKHRLKFHLRLKDIRLALDLLQFEYSKPSYGFDFIDFMDRAIKERISKLAIGE